MSFSSRHDTKHKDSTVEEFDLFVEQKLLCLRSHQQKERLKKIGWRDRKKQIIGSFGLEQGIWILVYEGSEWEKVVFWWIFLNEHSGRYVEHRLQGNECK